MAETFDSILGSTDKTVSEITPPETKETFDSILGGSSSTEIQPQYEGKYRIAAMAASGALSEVDKILGVPGDVEQMIRRAAFSYEPGQEPGHIFPTGKMLESTTNALGLTNNPALTPKNLAERLVDTGVRGAVAAVPFGRFMRAPVEIGAAGGLGGVGGQGIKELYPDAPPWVTATAGLLAGTATQGGLGAVRALHKMLTPGHGGGLSLAHLGHAMIGAALGHYAGGSVEHMIAGALVPGVVRGAANVVRNPRLAAVPLAAAIGGEAASFQRPIPEAGVKSSLSENTSSIRPPSSLGGESIEGMTGDVWSGGSWW